MIVSKVAGDYGSYSQVFIELMAYIVGHNLVSSPS